MRTRNKAISAFTACLCMTLAFAFVSCDIVPHVTPDTAGTSAPVPAVSDSFETITVDDIFSDVVDDEISIGTSEVSVTVDVSNGITIKSIYDKNLGHEYLLSETPVFRYTIFTDVEKTGSGAWKSGGEKSSRREVTADKKQVNESRNAVSCSAVSDDGKLSFDVYIGFTDPMTFETRISVMNLYGEAVYVLLAAPHVSKISFGSHDDDAEVMIPQEAGWIAAYDGASHMGYEKIDGTSGLPTSVNSMETVAVYSEKLGGGLFFADTEGYIGGPDSEIRFVLDGYEIEGLWGVTLAAGETRQTPPVVTGLFRDSDWRYAVNYFMSRRDSALTGTDVPSWWLDAAGVYSTHPGAGGPFTFWYGTGRIPTFINSFDRLDEVLDESRLYGIDVILLQDWYECPERGNPNIPESWWNDKSLDPYSWNKGDYFPREDMGGADAFRTGIENVHEKGGKVIVYVEPYIILYWSRLAESEAKNWFATDVFGRRREDYQYNFSMVPSFEKWQNKLATICGDLVRDYGVDGIYLDSLGWQFSHVNSVSEENGRIISPEDYDAGWVTLMKKVRSAVKSVKPDAVVLAESGCGPMLYTIDGGWTSDYAWGETTSANGLSGSPLRYSRSSLGVFTNGETVEEMNQVFAAGYSLAVSDPWRGHASYIKKLIEFRREYADAMIYGKQAFQPDTGEKDVYAYYFKGEVNEVVTVANAAGRRVKIKLMLGEGYSGSVWVDGITGASYTADSEGAIEISVRTDKAAALVRQ